MLRVLQRRALASKLPPSCSCSPATVHAFISANRGVSSSATADGTQHPASAETSEPSASPEQRHVKPAAKTPRHPMELLSHVFQVHPSALRLHRELTIALVEGDAARAADLASVLATTVQRVTASLDAPPTSDTEPFAAAEQSSTDDASASQKQAERAGVDGAAAATYDLPTPAATDVEEAVEKTRQTLLQQYAAQASTTTTAASAARSAADTPADTSGRTNTSPASSPLPFWRDSEQLCVTVLESAFETDVVDGEAQGTLTHAGSRAAAHEEEQMRILEAYLDKEAARWKAQKAAVAKIVLDVARALHVVPEDLQSAEGFAAASSSASGVKTTEEQQRLNVLRHSNLVIRGELPAASVDGSAETSVEAEFVALQERMTALGTPLTSEEAQMARYELQMSKSKMRYVVGLHRELQLALNSSAAVQRMLQQHNAAPGAATVNSGTELFMQHVIRALNEGVEGFSARAAADGETLSVLDVAAREAAETPVLPFTFMLKCCLWFAADLSSSDAV